MTSVVIAEPETDAATRKTPHCTHRRRSAMRGGRQDDGAEVHYEWHCPEAGWVRWACPEATEAREVRVSAPFPASTIRIADDLPVGHL